MDILPGIPGFGPLKFKTPATVAKTLRITCGMTNSVILRQADPSDTESILVAYGLRNAAAIAECGWGRSFKHQFVRLQIIRLEGQLGRPAQRGYVAAAERYVDWMTETLADLKRAGWEFGPRNW